MRRLANVANDCGGSLNSGRLMNYFVGLDGLGKALTVGTMPRWSMGRTAVVPGSAVQDQ